MEKLQGVVKQGHKRGKKFGFPTINILPDKEVPEGIYISQITIAGEKYNALTFIGAAKTFNETEVLAETFVFDFDQDIYGQTVSISLLKKLRDNQKFESEDTLIKQMEQDKQEAIAFFSTASE